MTGEQEAWGRHVAAAIAAFEFRAGLTEEGVGGARVEVRHPAVERNGVRWLVAIVSLEGRAPRVTYAEPMYRVAVERSVATAMDRLAQGGWL